MHPHRLWILTGCLLLLQACVTSPGIQSPPPEVLAKTARVVDITPQSIAEIASTPLPAPAELPAELLAADPPAYVLGPYDQLFITVWDYPELTAPGGTDHAEGANIREIGADGLLFFPFVGQVRAAGLTPSQLRYVLTEALERFIGDPQVDVRLAKGNSRRVVLGGDFLDGSTLPLSQQPLSLREGMVLARYQPAPGDELELVREGRRYMLPPAAAMSTQANALYLHDEDQLILTRKRPAPVSVVGEVVNPLSLQSDDLTLMQALLAAGGLRQDSADASAVWVIREGESEAVSYRLDASAPQRLPLAERFMLQPGDVVLVGATGASRWVRGVKQLLPNRKENAESEEL